MDEVNGKSSFSHDVPLDTVDDVGDFKLKTMSDSESEDEDEDDEHGDDGVDNDVRAHALASSLEALGMPCYSVKLSSEGL